MCYNLKMLAIYKKSGFDKNGDIIQYIKTEHLDYIRIVHYKLRQQVLFFGASAFNGRIIPSSEVGFEYEIKPKL